MNNFDLFKLLGGLFDFYQKNSSKNSPPQSGETSDKETPNSQENQSKTTSPFGLENLFSGLFNGNSESQNQNASTERSNAKRTAPPQNSAAPLPLQAQMLSTMRSHDQIVKRVKEKSPIKTV